MQEIRKCKLVLLFVQKKRRKENQISCTTKHSSVAQVAYLFLLMKYDISTLFHGSYDIITTLFDRHLNVSQSYLETNLAGEKYGFADRLISFILLNDKIFFTIY